MSRTPRPRRRSARNLSLTVAAALVATLTVGPTLTACSAGQVTQTDTQVSAVNGAAGQAGAILVRNAVLAHPENARYFVGEQVPLLLTIVNEGPDADQLTSASSPVANSVTISGDSRIPGGTLVGVGVGATATASGGPVSEYGATATPGTLAVHTFQVMLSGLTTELSPGQTYPVTLVFAKAGRLTLPLPIGDRVAAPSGAL